jgi:hypothetical protein
MKLIKIIPPIISQTFNAKLLSLPAHKLRDSTDCIAAMLKTVEKLWYKIQNNPRRLARCEALKQEILHLYERAKIKEKEREGETDHKTQGFGYHVAMDEKMGRDVYWRLRFGRKSGAHRYDFRSNDAVQKVQGVKR